MADGPFQRLQRLLSELKRRKVYRVAAAYLTVAFVGIQAARLLVPPTTLPAWSDDLLIYLAVFGFPVALVLAWAFEVTPEGVQRTPDGDEPLRTGDAAEGAHRGDGSTVSIVVLVGGIAAVGLTGGVWWMWGGTTPQGPAESHDRSVAVLPFDDLSPEEDREELGLGLTEAVIAELALVEDLSVTSRTSVMRYRNSDLALPAIADSLGVSHVLEGSIRANGDSVRITAQLIRADRDRHVWTATYERAFSDIFEIQGEVARRVAHALEAELTREARERLGDRPTDSPAAYRLYLRGRDLTATRDRANLTAAIELFRQAIRLDSSFALGYVGLSRAFERRGNLAVEGAWSDSTLRAARRAVELDPDLADAHRILGRHLHVERGWVTEAERHLKRAVALEPGGGWCYCDLAWLYYWAGNIPEALRWYWRSLPLVPENALSRLGVARAMFVFRETAAARAWMNRARALMPDSDPRILHPYAVSQGAYDTLRHRLKSLRRSAPNDELTLLWRGVLAQVDGNPDAARTFYGRVHREAPGRDLWAVGVRTRLAQAILASGGDSARADELLEEVVAEYTKALEKGDETATPRVQLAAAHAVLGERGEAYRWLDSIPVTLHLRQPLHDPVFRSLRGAETFEEWRTRARRRAMEQKQRAMRWARENGIDWPPGPDDSPVDDQ